MKKQVDGRKGTKARPNLLIIIIAIVLSLLLIFGIVLGTVLIVREVTSVASFGGIYIDEGVASYLAASFKYSYLVALGEDAFDGELFWQQEMDDGVTYGEMLEKETESYIRGILVGAYLYNMTKSLSASEREYLETNTREVLEYQAKGDIGYFNSVSAEMGFDYDDFCVGTELAYKAVAAKNVLYGVGGSELKSGGYFGDCNTYFDTFSRVRMLFIRTENDFIIEEGEFVRDSLGQYKTYELTDSEKAQRQADIEEIRSLIYGLENDLDSQISTYYFSSMIEKYNSYDDYKESGYYFSNMSEYTAGFATEVGKAAVDSALGLKEDEYAEVEYDDGIIFIYRMENDPFAYLNPDYEVFFTDFYPDAAAYLFAKALTDSSPMVKVKESYYSIDVISLPYNSQFVVRGTA